MVVSGVRTIDCDRVIESDYSWPQMLDTLLDDMSLPSMRSGGNALTWPFQVIDVKEIANLREEREALRNAIAQS